MDKDRMPQPSFKTGRASSQQVRANGTPVTEVSADIARGMSGGPTIDSNGEVLGVNSMGFDGEVTNFITDAPTLRAFLEQNGVDLAEAPAPEKSFPWMWIGVAVAVAVVAVVVLWPDRVSRVSAYKAERCSCAALEPAPALGAAWHISASRESLRSRGLPGSAERDITAAWTPAGITALTASVKRCRNQITEGGYGPKARSGVGWRFCLHPTLFALTSSGRSKAWAE